MYYTNLTTDQEKEIYQKFLDTLHDRIGLGYLPPSIYEDFKQSYDDFFKLDNFGDYSLEDLHQIPKSIGELFTQLVADIEEEPSVYPDIKEEHLVLAFNIFWDLFKEQIPIGPHLRKIHNIIKEWTYGLGGNSTAFIKKGHITQHDIQIRIPTTHEELKSMSSDKGFTQMDIYEPEFKFLLYKAMSNPLIAYDNIEILTKTYKGIMKTFNMMVIYQYGLPEYQMDSFRYNANIERYARNGIILTNAISKQ